MKLGHEAAFAKAFLPTEKRARFVQNLAQTKRRKEVLVQLNDHLPYLRGYATPVPSEQDFPLELEKLLIAKGAGATCHLISEGLKADGHELPLSEALRLICLHDSGAILSCVAGHLAYYRPAPPGAGILLERP